MPTPIDVNLDDYSLSNLNGLWNSSSNSVLFDSTRETGAEEFQGDWVNLLDVKLVNPDDSGWMANGTVLVENPAGHEFMLQLGNFTPGTAPTGYFNATGIFDQEGNSNLAGARRRQLAGNERLRSLGDGPQRHYAHAGTVEPWSWQSSRW